MLKVLESDKLSVRGALSLLITHRESSGGLLEVDAHFQNSLRQIR